MQKTNPEQMTYPWSYWTVLDDEILDGEEDGVQLMVDGEGGFHLVRLITSDEARVALDPKRATEVVHIRDISGHEAARLWLTHVVPDSLVPFLCLRKREA